MTAAVRPFSRVEKLFIFFAMIAGFSISAEYAATRPSSSAIFLSTFSSHAIPWVWLISVPFNLFIVTLYNRFLPKIGPLKMVGIVGSIITATHIFCALFLQLFPNFIFVQFILKDIYIVLMFKQLWSMIHSTIPASRAKYLYGCIFGIGTLGAISGSLIPSFFAVHVGSEQLFLCTIPLYLIVYYSYKEAFKRSPLQSGSFGQDLTLDPRPSEGFALIRRSPFLIAVLLLVIFMQISVGLMDYQFNAHLEMNIFDKDLRTEYVGRIVGLTNALSLGLQFIGGFLMVRIFGVRGSHLFIPLVLLGNAITAMVIPSFALISFAYVFIKSIDFSLFGVVREMLYLPMKMDEKFRAKAIIDVFAYRSAKALVSICILGLQFFLGSEILGVTSVVSTVVCLGWIAVVIFMFQRVAPPIQVR
jgi:ATP:ADP antiporter, AAA family